jgi:hypothetical protein
VPAAGNRACPTVTLSKELHASLASSAASRYIVDHVMNLQVHLHQRFMHRLHVLTGHLHQLFRAAGMRSAIDWDL